MRVLARQRVNPLLLPPDTLRRVLVHIKDDIRQNPQLRLPQDPDKDIWSYYSVMKVTPVVTEKFLMIILTIPLIDQSLEMDLYKVHNLPAIHPQLHVQFTYKIEGEYLAISKGGLYAAIPKARDIEICVATSGNLCMMNQALYPVEKIEWCIYAHFEENVTKIEYFCIIDTTERHVNFAQSLDGYMWAVSSVKEEKLQIRCLKETTIAYIKPPLTILHIGNGCEAYNSNLFIPAKSELTSKGDDSLVRIKFFIKFNEKYQDITTYGMFELLGFQKLTKKEMEELPMKISKLPPMTLNHLNKRIQAPDMSYPFSVPTSVIFIILMVSLVFGIASLGFCVWRIYKVRSQLTGIKPIMNLLLGDKKEDTKGLDKNQLLELLSLLKSPVAHATTKAILSEPSTSQALAKIETRPVIIKPLTEMTAKGLVDDEEIEELKQYGAHVTACEESVSQIREEVAKKGQTTGRFKKYFPDKN